MNYYNKIKFVKSKKIRLYKIFILLIIPSFYVQLYAQDIKINPDIRYQEIEGWGTSLSWWANHVGGWSDVTVDSLIHDLTSPDELNMNIFKYNLHGGDNPAFHADTIPNHFQAQMGEITSYKPTSTSPYNWSANANQRNILNKILAENSKAILEAIAYSPPYWMTNSSCSGGGTNGVSNLPGNNIGLYADYLTDIVEHYHDTLGITFESISPFNEPDGTWWKEKGPYEGCAFSVTQQIELIDSIYVKLQEKTMLGYTSISVAENNSIESTFSTFNGYLHGDSILSKLGKINTHGYSLLAAVARSGVSDFATSNNKTLWQSESGPINTYLYGIDNHLFMAQNIIADLKGLHANAWLDWQAVSTSNVWGFYTYKNSDFTEAQSGESLIKNSSYYIRKQFSKYIKKDYQIIHTPDSNVIAALDPAKTELVVVLVNPDTTNVTKNIDLSKFSSTGSTTTKIIRTSETENTAELSNISITNSTLNYTATEQSVTTFVIPVTVSAPPTQLVSGLYQIKAKHSNKYIAVNGYSELAGEKIVQYTNNQADNMKFVVEKVGYEYIIKPKYNEFLLSVDGSSTTNGAKIVQNSNLGFDNQRFFIIPDENGYYKIVNKKSNLSLAVSSESTEEGAEIVQWEDLDTDNFKWEFTIIKPTVTISNGDYEIKAVHSDKYMSVDQFSSSNGAYVLQWENLNQDNQKFTFTQDFAGYYKIKPIYNDKL